MAKTQSLAPRDLRDYRDLLGAIVACEAVGGVTGALTAESITTWYTTLEKPPFNPPNGIFGPVWTALYLLMGVSLYLTRKAGARGRDAGAATRLFAVQLTLNALWPLIFFRLRSPRWAFVEILALWVALALTIRAIARISGLAALLLAPYLLWVSFAALLNYSVWRRNT